MKPPEPTTVRPPMPPAEFLAAVTMVGERAAAGYGWQEGYLAGRAAAAADIRAFADKKERSARECPPSSAEAFRRNDAVLGAYRRAAEIADQMVSDDGYMCPPDGYASCADQNGTTGGRNCAHCRATVAERPAQVVDAHPWQEYNAHGYLCHYPGCQMTPDEHPEIPRP